MDQFLILLYSDNTAFRKLSPQEMQAAVGKYRAWSQKLRDSGRLAGSNKLEDRTGRVLRGAGEMEVTDGPYTESKEVVGGYYLFHAANFEEAVEICGDCPHLQFGTIEVRKIEKMG